MVSESGKNSDYFQDHLNSSNWGIWTREIESKEDLTVIELHNRLSWSHVRKNIEHFGNLRDFYFLQDHTTSNNDGERQG